MNQVDCSPETVSAEWDRIAADLGPAAAPPVGYARTAESPGPESAGIVERLRGTLLIAFKLGFGWMVPAWRVTDEECARLAEVWARVGAKYLPASWLRWLPATAAGGASECVECDALVVTVQVVMPRLKPKAEGKAEKPESEQKGDRNGKGSSQFAYAADWPES